MFDESLRVIVEEQDTFKLTGIEASTVSVPIGTALTIRPIGSVACTGM